MTYFLNFILLNRNSLLINATFRLAATNIYFNLFSKVLQTNYRNQLTAVALTMWMYIIFFRDVFCLLIYKDFVSSVN